MGRSFYVSGFRDKGEISGPRDGFVDLEFEMREHGDRHSEADQAPLEIRQVGNKRRVFRKDAALGFSTEDVHYAGDRIVQLKEVPVQGGHIDYYFQRFDDSGKSLGTYVQRWEKAAEGRHVSTGRARRTRSF